jgi:putative ABC transport system permease protein
MLWSDFAEWVNGGQVSCSRVNERHNSQSMKTPLAWHNLIHQKKRTLVAVAGVAFAALLIFMQLGFFGAAQGTATIIYDQLDFDVVLLAPQYIDINRPGTFPAERLQQALAVQGVESASPVYVGAAPWRNPDAPARYAYKPQTIMVLGFRPEDEVFRRDGVGIQQVVDQHRAELQMTGPALIDDRSHAEFGRFDPGQFVEVGPQKVEVVGRFSLGTGFGANGLIVVSDSTFLRIREGFPSGRASMGLIRVAAGVRSEDVAARLADMMPKDVIVLTAAQLGDRERGHWVEETSLGLIFRLGVGVALFVGIVFVYQVIASDIANRLHEYATLKAMGYGPAYLASVVLKQAALIAVLGFFPGLAGALGLYALARGATGIPIGMTAMRIALVFVLTVVMCSASGVLALRKVQSADPAELF